MDKGADHSDPPSPANAPISAGLAVPSPDRPVPSEYDLLCESCGYSLVGLMTDRCPECGHGFDPAALPLARVPWLYRKRLGPMRAYLRTVRMVLTDPTGVASELRRPSRISEPDARAFRLASVMLVPIGLLVAAAVWWGGELPTTSPGERVFGLFTAGSAALMVWWFAYLVTDMPTFIWRGLPESPDRLAPVHHYASAPLALSVALLPLSVVLLRLLEFLFATVPRLPRQMPWYVQAASALPLVPIVWLMWRIPLRLMGAGGPGLRARRIWMGLYLPLHWLIMGMFVFILPILWAWVKLTAA
jgi:hypothetical protein